MPSRCFHLFRPAGLLAALLLLPSLCGAQEASAAAVRLRARVASEEPAAATRRAQRFARSHGGVKGGTAAEAMAAARAKHLSMVNAQAAQLSTAWTSVGPVQVQSESYGMVTGRVTALALDPNDASNNTLYLGSSGGGVWKSTNAASSTVSFAPLTDTLPVFSPNAGSSVIPSLSIGALSVQPGGTGVILAGTGDPNDAADSFYGQGILRSTNSGQTWSLIQSTSNGSFNGEGIAGFAWSTASPALVVVAVSTAAEAVTVGASRYPGVRGLYYSTNAGASWTLATIQDGSTIVQNRTTNYTSFRGNAVTSVVWNPVRKKFYAAVRSHGYYESPDGATWTRMTNQPGAGLTTANCPPRPGDNGLLACPIFRGTITAQPTSGDLFAVTVDANDTSQGLWQDACAKSGTACASNTPAWTTKLDTASVETNGAIATGDYNLTLAAIPAATALSTTDTLLFLGTGDLYRCSLAGGCVLRNTTNATTGCAAPAGVAPAQHALAWGANLSNTATPAIFLGNDGGLWRSLDGVRQQAAICSADDATHFDNLNGTLGSLAEVVSLSSHPSDSSVMLAALGANGAAASSTATQAAGSSPWTQLTAAESGSVSIDQGNGGNWLLQSGTGVALHNCTNGKQCTAADFAGPATIGYSQTSNDASLVDPPALLDPALNTNVLLGTCRVWRGPASGDSLWSTSNAISAPMLGLLSGGACTSGNATIRSLAAGGAVQLNSASQNSGSPVLYAGLSGFADGGAASAGHIFTTASAGTAGASTAWRDLTGNSVTNDLNSRFNAGGFDISSIAVDHADPTGMTVYATVQGFNYPHVYRSTNGGATWLNITANLANAPANAVAVDPNDPHVVYVALDTGVYVASDVTSCFAATSGTAGACWSVYGTALPNAPVTALSVTADLLRAGTYGRGIWQIPLLTAGQTSAPIIAFSPASLTFAAQKSGTTSTAQTVTLTNTGTAALQISGVQPPTGFLGTDTCAAATLPVNATCTLKISFAPAAAGISTSTVQVVANVAGGYASLPLTGTATGVSRLVVSPTAISFGDVALNTVSASQTATVTNTGSAEATLTTPTVTTGYRITASTCGSTLPVAGNCTLSVAFVPTTPGPNNGSLALSDGNAAVSVALSANAPGTPNIVSSATSFTFANGPVNTVVSGVVLTLTNTGTAVGHLGPLVLVGDFMLVRNNCSTTLIAGSSCSTLIYFTPTALGLRTGTLTYTDDAGTHVITLRGSAYAATTITLPSRMAFPDTAVNSVSPPQIVTVSNSGLSANVGITQVDGDFGVTATTCSGKLGTPNGPPSCTLTVVFAPTLDGPRSGYLMLTLSSTSYYVLLSGTGVGTPSVNITPASVDFGTVGVGSLGGPQTVQITNSGTAALTLQSQTITDDFHIAANTCTATLAVQTSCALTLSFTPSTAGPHSGVLTLVDAVGTHTVSLAGSGSGHASVGVTPAAVDFGIVLLGQNAPQSVTVTNTGDADIGLLTPVATGDFRVDSTTCGSRIAAGATCTVTVVFSPSADGGRTGTLTVADDAASHTVVLTGTGRGASSLAFTPSSLVFGNAAVNGVTAAQTVTLLNSGTAAATLQPATVAGDFRFAGNTCGASLGTGATCTVDITFAPAAVGFRSGALSLSDADSTHSVALQGTGTAGVMTLSPTAVSFYDTTLNTTTVARTVSLTNTGNGPLSLGTITVTDDFAVSQNCNGVVLSGGAACTLSVTFSPRSAGAHAGTVSVPSDSNGVAGTLSTIALTGNGKSAFNITLTPTAVDFGTQLIGSASSVVNITVSNTGITAGGLGTISVSGADFSIRANTCGATLQPQTGCTVSLVFAPSASGVRTGSLTIPSDAGTQTVTLTGVGQTSATDTLSQLALTFTQTTVGINSATQTVTLTNSGDVPLTLVAAQILSGDFTATNRCGPTVAAHTTCGINVAFAPRSVGLQTGLLQISDVLRSQTVALTGTGLAPVGVSLTPASLTFANTGVGVVGAGQLLTVSNTSPAAVTLTGITVAGNFGILAGNGNCSTAVPVPAGGACTLGIAFLPQGAGVRSGSVTVITPNATLSSQLGGTGIDFTFASNGSDTATLSSGGSAAYPLLLRPVVTTNDTVTFTCTGAPSYTKCTVTPQYNDLSATSTVTVTLLTGTTAKSIPKGLPFALLLLPICAVRRSRRYAALLLLCCVTLAVQGCGSNKVTAISGTGTGGSGGSAPVTPTGNYTITVSATAAGVTHTVPLTLKVQ